MSSTKRGRKRNRADNYPTPGWAVRRILDALMPSMAPRLPLGKWLEPCAGNGAIIRATNEWLDSVGYSKPQWTAVEIRPGAAKKLEEVPGLTNIANADFFACAPLNFTVIISNPPFSLAMEFIEKCMAMSEHVIMLLRLNFLASEERSEFMQRTRPDVYVLPNRPSFVLAGKTDSIEYAWFHWHKNSTGIVRVLPTTPIEERRTRRKK